MKKSKFEIGFTLIELVVVLAILAILSAIAVPRYLSNLEKARVATHNANVRAIKATAMVYQADKGVLLNNLSDLSPEYLDVIPEIPEGLSDFITDEQYSDGYIIEVGKTYFNVIPGIIP